jgi:hypothetical protein
LNSQHKGLHPPNIKVLRSTALRVILRTKQYLFLYTVLLSFRIPNYISLFSPIKNSIIQVSTQNANIRRHAHCSHVIKTRRSETGICLRLHIKPALFCTINGPSPYLQTTVVPTNQNANWGRSIARVQDVVPFRLSLSYLRSAQLKRVDRALKLLTVVHLHLRDFCIS